MNEVEYEVTALAEDGTEWVYTITGWPGSTKDQAATEAYRAHGRAVQRDPSTPHLTLHYTVNVIW